MSNVLGVKITGDGSDLKKALETAGRDISAFGNQTASVATPLDSFANSLKTAFVGSSMAVGLITLKNSLMDVTSAMATAQIQLDQFKNGLNFAVGRSNAGAEMDFVRGTVKSMGLELASASQQYVKLAAAARGTSMEGQKTRDIFTAVSQASTVLGLSTEQTEGALRSLGQMISKNTVMSEELKGQFSEHIPGGFQMASRAMGVTTEQMNKMLESGQVLAGDLIPKLTTEITKMTAPEVVAASNSMLANINKLSTAWIDLKQAVAQSGVSSILTNEIGGLTNYLTLLTETMDRSRKSGDGLAEQWSTTLLTALARVPFDTAATAANVFNGSLNLLSLGALDLKTNINLLPQAFETNAQKAAALTGRLNEAEADLSKLQDRLAIVPDNIYLKSQTHQAWLLVQQLRDAKELQGQLYDATNISDSVASARIGGEARTAWELQNKANQASLQKIKDQQNGVPDGYAKALAEIERLHAAGTITGKEYTDMVAKQQALLTKKTGGISDAAKGLSLYNDLMDAGAGFERTWAENANTLRAALNAKLISQEQFNASVLALYAKQPMIVAAAKAEKDAIEATTKARADAFKEQDKANASAQEAVKKQLEHNATIGLGTMALADLAAANLELQAVELDRKASLQDGVMWDLAIADGYRSQAQALRDLASAKVAGAQKQIGVDAAKQAADAWQKASEKIEQDITDALMRGFESGQGFAENLKATLENMFKTMVLRPMVSAIVQPISQDITSVMSGGGTSASSFLSPNWAGNNVQGTADWLMTSQDNTLASMGDWLNTNSASAAAFAKGAGQVLGYGQALMDLGSGKTGSALGGAIGTYFGGPLGTAIGSAIGASLFGEGQISTSGTGSASRAFDANGIKTGVDYAYAPYGGMSAVAESSITALQSGYATTAKALGIKMAEQTFSYGGNTGKDGAAPNFDYAVSGAVAYGSGETPVSAAAMQLEASRVVFAALQGSELPKYLAGAFDGFNVASLSQDQITATLAGAQALKDFNSALSVMPGHFQALADQSYAVTTAIAAASGGLANLQGNLGTYYTNFYTAEEQRAQTIASINAAAAGSGLDAAAATRESFRAIVEAQDLTTASGQSTYAALLGVAGAFATLTPELSKVDSAKIAAANKSWQDKLDVLMGTQTERTLALRDAADDTTRALMQQVYAQEDLQSAAQASAEATKSVQAAWQSLADSLISEVRRIRGLLAGTGAAGYAQAQSSFAITTAQARAGDQDAAAALPSLSQSMLELAANNASTLVELRKIQALTAVSLSTTASIAAANYGITLPSFAVGTDYVPRDMIAQVHQGERIVPRAFNPAAGGSESNAALVGEIRALRAEVEGLRAEARSSAVSNNKTAKILERLTPDGDVLQVNTQLVAA